MIKRAWSAYSGFNPIPKVVITGCLIFLGYFLISSSLTGIKHAIFGNPEVKRANAGKVVAEEQIEAEANIADGTIQTVRERDVYREHVRTIVREGQESVNAVDHGQKMDPEIDAAVAAALCSVHASLCRGAVAEELQPVREPLPGED